MLGHLRQVDCAGKAGARQLHHVAVAPDHRNIEPQHLRLLRVVQEQFARRQSAFRGERIFHLDRARSVGGDPFADVALEVCGGALEGALVQLPVAQRIQQRRRRAGLERVQERLIGQAREFAHLERPRGERLVHETLVHRRCAAHGVVPVDVAVHLILGEQERLERREPFFHDADPWTPRRRVDDHAEGIDQAIGVDRTVRNSAHQRVALEVLDLVQVERAGDEPLQRRVRGAANQRQHALRRVRGQLGECLSHFTGGDQRARHLFVVRCPDLLERVGERIVPDVVQQRGGTHDRRLLRIDTGERSPLIEQPQGDPRQMIRA